MRKKAIEYEGDDDDGDDECVRVYEGDQRGTYNLQEGLSDAINKRPIARELLQTLQDLRVSLSDDFDVTKYVRHVLYTHNA